MLANYYNAAQTGAALAEKEAFGLLKFTGSERASWLQGMVTNDVLKLGPGAGCYAAHLTPQGKIVAQMQILADDDALWATLERAAIPGLVAAFDRLLIMEDVQIADLSDEIEILSLIGPASREIIEAWLGEPVSLDGLYAHQNFTDGRIIISDLGYDVWVRRDEERSALRSLARHGATAIDHGAWDVLRTEAGIPMYGVDIDDTTTMPELGERGINYDKGCYVGQEVVAKVKYIGHVNRRFVGLIFAGNELPETRSIIRKTGKDLGYVTTALFSPGLNKPIALGFVGRSAMAPGTEVEVVSEGLDLPAKVVELPFNTRAPWAQ
jgi:folate-binding protein YgfZ